MTEPIEDAQIEIYRQTARARAQSRRQELAARRRKTRELAAELIACFNAVGEDLENFCIFLERPSRPDGG